MAYGSRRRAIANTTYGRKVTRKVNRTVRDVNGVFAIVSLVGDLVDGLFTVIAWPFKKLIGLVRSEPETPNEPVIDMDAMAVIKRDVYMNKVHELRTQIDANDPSVDWRKVTFLISGATGSIQVKSSDKVEGAKIKAAYPQP